MNVLCHGIPFCCDWTPLQRYRGPHDIRSIGNHPDCQYRYDFYAEIWPRIVNRIAAEWPPDLALIWVPEIHPPPQRIEDSPIPTVALVSDWNVYYPILAANLMRYDHVLCDRPGVAVFSGPRLTPHHLMPLYSQISTIHRPHEVEKDIDILFVGNLNHAAHPQRGRCLERIARLADRYHVVITTNYVGDAYAHLLSRARIVLNHSIRGELNLRVFETLACNAVPCIESGNREVRDWFTDGVDIILYDENNLEERLIQFLERPNELDAIRAAAHARTIELAGETRFDALIEWAAAQPRGERAFHALPRSERDYHELLQYGFSRWNVYYKKQDACIATLARTTPGDPRTWSAIARHLLDPRTPVADESLRPRDVLKALHQAHTLDPSSAPRALNAASVARMYQLAPQEEHYLRRTLQASNIEGGGELLGTQADPTWTRWNVALATRSATVGIIHAEARIRLASILAARGELGEALDLLGQAAQDDPESAKGARLRAEILDRTGNTAEAVRILEQAVRATPFDFDNCSRLVDMLDALHRRDEAQYWREDTALLNKALV